MINYIFGVKYHVILASDEPDLPAAPATLLTPNCAAPGVPARQLNKEILDFFVVM